MTVTDLHRSFFLLHHSLLAFGFGTTFWKKSNLRYYHLKKSKTLAGFFATALTWDLFTDLLGGDITMNFCSNPPVFFKKSSEIDIFVLHLSCSFFS